MLAGKTAVREFAAAFALLTIGYLLLVGQFTGAEVGLALGGGVFAALWAMALNRVADIRFSFEWKAFAVFATAVAGVPLAAARVTWVLFRAGRRRPRGSIIEQKFDHGRDRSAADVTRRAAVLLAISLAPDRFALLHEGDRLVIHRIGRAPQGGDERWPS
jgi:multisubunit Na+/H+ antiporter MnhE subunit